MCDNMFDRVHTSLCSECIVTIIWRTVNVKIIIISSSSSFIIINSIIIISRYKIKTTLNHIWTIIGGSICASNMVTVSI